MIIKINHNGKTAEEIYGVTKDEIVASLIVFSEKIKVADYGYEDYDKFILIVALMSVLARSSYIAIISILGKSPEIDKTSISGIVELLLNHADEFIKQMAPAFELYLQMKENKYVNSGI